MNSKLNSVIASTTLSLKKKRKRAFEIVVSLGDLKAYSHADEQMEVLPFGDMKSCYWRAKIELNDGHNSPFIKEVQAADSIQALYFALQSAGDFMTKIYGTSEDYKDMLPNYGFPGFEKQNFQSE